MNVSFFSRLQLPPLPPRCLKWFGLTLLASQTRSVYLRSTRLTLLVAQKKNGSREVSFSEANKDNCLITQVGD